MDSEAGRAACHFFMVPSTTFLHNRDKRRKDNIQINITVTGIKQRSNEENVREGMG